MRRFTYDLNYQIELPTCILSNVYHHHIGVINNIDNDSIQVSFNMNSQQEVSFDVYKEIDGVKCSLWDDIVGLRYVYIPEHEEYYKIEVNMDEDSATVKHLTLSSASEYELSNKIIRSLEINTESDILRNEYDKTGDIPEYTPNVLYNPNDPSNSILHRALADKAPDWHIDHVDSSIANIQRTFSVNNQKLYDFLVNTLAKEYDCLFQFNSVTRGISVYDLLNRCRDCGKRGEFVYSCSKCGSTNIQKGYGTDTNILINYNNYSTKMTLDGDENSVKNCFYVSGGDEILNADIANCNPSGGRYIYHFSDADYADMPPTLRQKLEEYEETYNQVLPSYQEYTAGWYEWINNYYYYKTSMMPRINGEAWEAEKGYSVGNTVYVKTLPSWCYLECVEAGTSGVKEFDATNVIEGEIIVDGTVKWAARKNIISIPSAAQTLNDIVAKMGTTTLYFWEDMPTSVTEVNNEFENVASLGINNIFRVEVIADAYNSFTGHIWYGNVKVYNTGDTDDVATTDSPIAVNVDVADSVEKYQKYMYTHVEERLNKADTTFTEIYKLDDENFKATLRQYSLDSLDSFRKSYQGCLDTVMASVKEGKVDQNTKVMGFKIYDVAYKPYFDRRTWVEQEMAVRQATVNNAASQRDYYRGKMDEIQDMLALPNYLGTTLYNTLYNYIREDSYQNSNYVSTGLSDGERINKAKELLEVANDELTKACEIQVTLSDTLGNLYNTKEFKDYKNSLEIGNYLICEVDETPYRLRLIGVSYSYSSPQDINLKFANFTKVNNYFSDAQNIISSAQAISNSYSSVVHQVKNNTDVANTISTVMNNGMSSNSSSLSNNDKGEVTFDEAGVELSYYDAVQRANSKHKVRMTSNGIYYTEDDWETTTTGVGEMMLQVYNKNTGEVETKQGYGMQSKYVNNGVVSNSQIVSGDIYSDNYDEEAGTGTHVDLNNGTIELDGTLLDDFQGATEESDGKRGFVPKPTIADVGKFLNADGTWQEAGGGNYYELTNDEYEALPEEEKLRDDALYFITDLISAGEFIEISKEDYEEITPSEDVVYFVYDDESDEHLIYLNGRQYGGSGSGNANISYGTTEPTGGSDGDVYFKIDNEGNITEIYQNHNGVWGTLVGTGLQYWNETSDQIYREYEVEGMSADDGYIFSNQEEWKCWSYGYGRVYYGSFAFKKLNDTPAIIVAVGTTYPESTQFFLISTDESATKWRYKSLYASMDWTDPTGGSDGDTTRGSVDGSVTDNDGTTWYYSRGLFGSTGRGPVPDYEFNGIEGSSWSSTDAEWVEYILGISHANPTTAAMVGIGKNGKVLYHIENGNYIAYLDENGVYKGTDFKVGDTSLVEMINAKQDKLVQGTNITIGADGKTISATDTDEVSELTDVELTNLADGQVLKYNSVSQKWINANGSGGTTVVANPSGTATDTLNKVQIDNTIYSLPSGGGGGGSGYETTNLWTGSQTLSRWAEPFTLPNITLDVLDDYDELSFDVINNGNPSQRRFTTDFLKNHLDEYPVNPIAVDGTYSLYIYCDSVNDCIKLYCETNRGYTVKNVDGIKYGTGGGGGSGSGYSEEQLYIATSTSFSNITVDWDWNAYDAYIFRAWDTVTSNQSGDSTFLTKQQVLDAISNNVPQYFSNSFGYASYNISASTLTTVNHSSSMFLQELVGIKFEQGGGGGSEVIPNPQGTATDTLNTIEIDGTIFDLSSGAGGSGYSETELWADANGQTFSNQSTYTANLDGEITGYDMLEIEFAPSTDPTWHHHSLVPVNQIDITGTNGFMCTIAGGNAGYVPFVQYIDADTLLFATWGRAYSVNVYKIVGIKFGNGSGGGGTVFEGLDYSNAEDLTLPDNNGYDYTPTEDGALLITGYGSATVSIQWNTSNSMSLKPYGDTFSTVWVFVEKDITYHLSKGGGSSSSFGAGSVLSFIPLKQSSSGGGGSSEVNYSTEEQEIGTWIDGSPLYQKTVEYSVVNLGASGAFDITSDFPITYNIRNSICEFEYDYQGVHYSLTNAPTHYFNRAGNVNTIKFSMGSGTISGDLTVTLQYTKTTD